MNHLLKFSILLLLACQVFKGHAQTEIAKIEGEVRQLIVEDSIQKASKKVDNQIEQYNSKNDYESLAKMVYWLGKIEITSNAEKLFPKAIELFQEIKAESNSTKALFHAHLGISKLHNEKGNAAKAFEIADRAKTYALSLKDNESLADVFYALGEYGLRSGNINTFEEYIRKAHSVLQSNPEQKFKNSPRILNYLGAVMYLTSKPDSALFYYSKALTKIDVMEKSSENQLYFPAAVKANMVLLKQAQNKYEEAMVLAKECIFLNTHFLESEKTHPLRYRSQRNLSLAYRNLVSLYEQIGDYEMCERIADLAYNQAKADFEPQLLEYFSAVTLLAEAKILNKDFDNAINICREAESSIEKMPGQNPLLKANLYSILGSAFYGKKNYSEAMKYYGLGNEFHEMAQEGEYSSDRLFVTMNLALCYAHLGKKDKALTILENAHEASSENGRLKNAVLMAQAQVADILNDYDYLLASTEKFLAQDFSQNNVANDEYRPQMIAMNAKATYHSNSANDTKTLQKLASNLQDAVQLLEKKRSLIANQDNIGEFIQYHEEVFDFGKKINLELYNRTGNLDDLKNVLNFHESSIYNKIRSRLNLKQSVSSFKLGQKTASREKALKEKINSEIEDASEYLKNIEEWNSFLDSLKISNPRYYKMRYASIAIPLSNLKEQIAKNTTLIRYFFIADSLHAYVANSNLEKLIPLESKNLELHIEDLSNYNIDVSSFSNASNELYKQLWQPIETYVSTQKVIIFPDRQLFNLSFDLLTYDELSSFDELSQQSLLSEFFISYNYSLLLLGENKKTIAYENDFIAFAPEFNTSMKTDYQVAITDSINLDKTYLTLLPQPFIADIADRFSRKFNGSSFLNKNASKQLFKKEAKEHKIIHIGTHAESNNVSPELSRLVFAKNISDSTSINDNYLYTYEIYNQDLSSNLAILTACETGKPSYQPGEGMISLAHAFNYAGSESILTSLWQIDEQSSTQILEYFYTYLEDGLPKDEALMKAKLEYLSKAEGRTVHPQYWAGLVLMGDTSPIELSGSQNWLWWLLAAFALLMITILMRNKRKNLR